MSANIFCTFLYFNYQRREIYRMRRAVLEDLLHDLYFSKRYNSIMFGFHFIRMGFGAIVLFFQSKKDCAFLEEAICLFMFVINDLFSSTAFFFNFFRINTHESLLENLLQNNSIDSFAYNNAIYYTVHSNWSSILLKWINMISIM